MPILRFVDFSGPKFIGCQASEIYIELTDSIENVINMN
jgi:hypothetical protein